MNPMNEQVEKKEAQADDDPIMGLMDSDPSAFLICVRRLAKPEESISATARKCGVSRQAVYRALERGDVTRGRGER